MLKISFSGYDGKMGSKILEYLTNFSSYSIVNKINKNTKDPFSLLKNSNVVIDFSNKKFAYLLALYCGKNKIPFISGTTGFSKDELDEINKVFLDNKVGALICPNFSKGIEIIKKSLPFIKNNYQNIILEETHNISKLDSPSGTALQLKSKLNNDVKIISKRKKHYNAVHKLVFFDDYEELILIHKVKSKYAYGQLVINAIEQINTFIGLKQEII